jgi:hypothetical protein
MKVVNPMYSDEHDADEDSEDEKVIKVSVGGGATTSSSSDGEVASAVPSKREPSPEESASLWSRTFFNWVGGLMTKIQSSTEAWRRIGVR